MNSQKVKRLKAEERWIHLKKSFGSMEDFGFSIIIPVKKINDYLRESIPEILHLEYDDFELIILPNQLPNPMPKFLLHPKIRVIASGSVSPAIKRDLGGKNSRFSFLAFLDDDAFPKKDWLKVADSLFKTSEVAAIGGPAMTPESDSISQQASGLFFETVIGGGGLDYRYKPAQRSFYVDDFPTVNFIIRKSVFFSIGGFDSHYWPGEDTKLCRDLIRAGHRIWYCRDLQVYHHRRHLWLPHLKQVGNYGKHRGYFAKKFPENSRKWLYFVPSIFLLGNLILCVGSLFTSHLFFFWLWALAFYFSIAAIDVFLRTRNILLGSMVIPTVFLSHLVYGFHFMRGLFSHDRSFRSYLR